MQRSVDQNPDLALHYSHEHQHKHLHHGGPALAGRHDEVLYADHTTTDEHFVNKNPQDYVKHELRKSSDHIHEKDFSSSVDAEKGAVDPTLTLAESSDDGRQHRVSRTYSKYKILVHLFIWLLFTG